MPLHTLVQIDMDAAYLLWEIKEELEELQEAFILSNTEKDELKKITHPRKRKEWLAARVALQRLLYILGYAPSSLHKNVNGKPMLVTISGSISIAHCKEFVLVAFSAKYPIGVDIEQICAKIRRVRDKLLCRQESNYVGDDLSNLSLYWCAKEAIYKTIGGGISLQEDIYIYPFNKKEEEIIWGQVAHHIFKVGYVTLSTKNDYILVWSREVSGPIT